MRLSLPLAVLLAMSVNTHAADAPAIGKTALVIHGGAGFVPMQSITRRTQGLPRSPEPRARRRQRRAQRGGSALDAVTAAVVVLEDTPQFNAGKGAVFQRDGAGMNSMRRSWKAIRDAPVRSRASTIRNPIKLAHTVMEEPHVMLAGEGAEAFADEHPEIQRVPNSCSTPTSAAGSSERAQAKEAKGGGEGQAPGVRRHASIRRRTWAPSARVALDSHGHIAAATGTGGMTNKKVGPRRRSRRSSAPARGPTKRCGVSGTGWGEFYIRNAVAHDICARVAYRGDSLEVAANEVVNKIVTKAGGDGVRSHWIARATSRCRSTAAACSAAGSSPTAAEGRRSTKGSDAPRSCVTPHPLLRVAEGGLHREVR